MVSFNKYLNNNFVFPLLSPR